MQFQHFVWTVLDENRMNGKKCPQGIRAVIRGIWDGRRTGGKN